MGNVGGNENIATETNNHYTDESPKFHWYEAVMWTLDFLCYILFLVGWQLPLIEVGEKFGKKWVNCKNWRGFMRLNDTAKVFQITVDSCQIFFEQRRVNFESERRIESMRFFNGNIQKLFIFVIDVVLFWTRLYLIHRSIFRKLSSSNMLSNIICLV